MLASGLAHAEISQEQLDADCAKIPSYASQGESFYKAKNYPMARNLFEQQATWSESCNLDDKSIATAYNNVALTWMREGQWRKARAWLMIKPDDAKSVYNLELIKDKLAALPRPPSATGEYWDYAGKATWNTLTLKPTQPKDTWQVDFQGYYFGMMGVYVGPNIGELSEKVTLKNDKGVIAVREDGNETIHCNISLSLSPEAIDASTDTPEDCGFGAYVGADGHYLRIN